MDWREYFELNSEHKVALYGLGTETERFIFEYGDKVPISALLDGFRKDGDMYGYSIMSIRKAIEEGITIIIVIARPGSCKAITKRIGAICRANDVELYDVRGKNLLVQESVRYDFRTVSGRTKAELIEKIKRADAVSFDLFDTLIMRKVCCYMDIFDLVDLELRRKGIVIPDFARRRLSAEKEVSRFFSPKLEEIYEDLLRQVGGCFMSAEELAEIEWKIDLSTLIPRETICKIVQKIIDSGKQVFITTDTYYTESRIKQIISMFGIHDYEELLISCEQRTSKTQGLFEKLLQEAGSVNVLHIGDSEIADIENAKKRGIDTYRIYSGMDLFDALGGMGVDKYCDTLADRIKCGLFVSKIFNDPFQFENPDRRDGISRARDIGYLFCGAMIADFTLWLKDKVKDEGYSQILFCARDGYLPGRLYRMADMHSKSIYFLASRVAAIRAGIENDDDIDYVDSMKFFGTPEEEIRTRYGIELTDIKEKGIRNSILESARYRKRNYQKYIEKLEIDKGKLAMFDFVAKGTTQMYLERILGRKLKGFYFLQLEPEFMADKGLNIEPFYTEKEKNESVIFENYYILETVLTSPYSQTEEFDEDGNPRFAKETRSESDICCFEQMQAGIMEYFKDYIGLLPQEARKENKQLDEAFLSLINKMEIHSTDFLSLKVEDPFFGRMTDIKDIIG